MMINRLVFMLHCFGGQALLIAINERPLHRAYWSGMCEPCVPESRRDVRLIEVVAIESDARSLDLFVYQSLNALVHNRHVSPFMRS